MDAELIETNKHYLSQYNGGLKNVVVGERKKSTKTTLEIDNTKSKYEGICKEDLIIFQKELNKKIENFQEQLKLELSDLKKKINLT